ncbi:hypothetical protein BJ165DRAFT_1358214 [Panaeolus papilionaceus]|nr:hypothetical protein BJ165DRAFT_1358214 [Panaeolus papilionaceus]
MATPPLKGLDRSQAVEATFLQNSNSPLSTTKSTKAKKTESSDEDAGKPRLVPNVPTERLHLRWEALLPTLVNDYLEYAARSHGGVIQIVGQEITGDCHSLLSMCKNAKSTTILCLYFDRTSRSPQSTTRIAVSIDLLLFHAALFQRSCDAVHALALALNSFYSQRGFDMLHKATKVKEPFRKSLGYASQWLDMLRLRIEDDTNAALSLADKEAQTYLAKKESHALMPPTFSATTECDQRLAKLCPACFGGNKFGRSLVSEGADFHIATDGNFHHRHLVNAGAGVPFHKNPQHIIPAEYVNKVGEYIDSIRKQPKKRQRKSRSSELKVPSEAIDECEKSYEAADGDKKKAVIGNERYDDQGLMSLVCRHDVPLFFANIDTPGEQQKYAVALILWFFQYIPQNATVVVLYDIGCVLDRSVSSHNILPKSILKRIRFTTTAMHAYGHQWSCQLAYNPRLVKGLGLTCGEGVERTWSKSRKMIGIVRSSSRARRIWVIDRQLSSIATDTRDDLGTWMKRRLRDVEKRTLECEEVIAASGHTAEKLREQWELQRATQLSARTHTPAKLKAEIACVLVLQEEIETLEARLASAKKGLKGRRQRKLTRKCMDSFQSQIEGLIAEVEELFVSLKIHRTYPELKGLGADFVRTLILASELKDTIRRQAVASFSELDRLDQAVGGRHQALGTKLHQQTRKALNKRSPALLAKIKKFNGYCDSLAALKPEDSNIPLPNHLSTKVAQLRDDPNLMEGVWITALADNEETPWMDDPTVRKGIQAILKLDRCLEERRRIGMEADNMCRQFGCNLLAAEIALRRTENSPIAQQLTTYRDHLLLLKYQWITPLATAVRYQTHVERSTTLANIIAGTTVLSSLNTASCTFEIDGEEDVELADVEEIDVGQLSSEDSAMQEVGVEDIEAMDKVEDEIMALDSDSEPGPSDSGSDDCDTISTSDEDSSDLEELDTDCGDLQILKSHSDLLNDVCLNGCAEIIQRSLNNSSAATEALNAQQSLQLTGSDTNKELEQALWKNSKRTSYWSKEAWILPIHRPGLDGNTGHWVLCVAYPRKETIYLYDSFAERRPWETEAKDVSLFFSQVVLAAKKQTDIDLGDWKFPCSANWLAVPALTRTVQSNGYDCGLWVLVWIAATLRGFHITDETLSQTDIPVWRRLLLNLVIQNTHPSD